MTAELVLAYGYALQTGKYRLDDSLILGRSGGGHLDPTRMQDLYISIDVNDIRETVPLIELILYGCSPPQLPDRDARCIAAGLPRPAELKRFDLAKAKALCKKLRPTGPAARFPRATNGGRFLIVDFLASPQARDAALVMSTAGLTGQSLLTMQQRPDMCGHLGAAWACAVRAQGNEFHTFSFDVAAVFNTVEYDVEFNAVLNHAQTKWLSGDEILELATARNPDNLSSDPAWLNGPGPFNFWRAHFVKTTEDARHHNSVQIWVVNTESQTSHHNARRRQSLLPCCMVHCARSVVVRAHMLLRAHPRDAS